MLKSDIHILAHKIIKIPAGSKCQNCGSQYKLNRHHPDYNKPLDVIILCASCHRKWHINNKPIERKKYYKERNTSRTFKIDYEFFGQGSIIIKAASARKAEIYFLDNKPTLAKKLIDSLDNKNRYLIKKITKIN
jgi:hypothetical protein